MKTKLTYVSLAVSSALLVACGGGGGGAGGTNTNNNTGTLPAAPTAQPLPVVSAAAPVSNNGGANFEFALVNGFNGDSENMTGSNTAVAQALTTSSNLTVVKAEMGQVNLKEPTSDYFALVANRDTLLRVVVVANQPNVVAPTLKVTVRKVNGGQIVFEEGLKNNTQGLLPQVADQPVVLLKGQLGKDEFSLPVSYPISDKAVKTVMPMPDLNRSYVIKLPASIITAEPLSIEVSLLDTTDAIATDNAKTYTFEPKVVEPLTIVKVPVTVNGHAPSVPSDDYLRRTLMAAIPVSNVIVKTRPVAVVSNQGDGISAPDVIGDSILAPAKNALTAARQSDVTANQAVESDYYMGFVKASNVGGVTSWGGFVAVVQDSLNNEFTTQLTKRGWIQEVLNDWGSVGDSGACSARLDDVNYPYLNGGLGGVWNIDLASYDNKVVLLNPRAYTSVTSYCANSLYMADNQVKRMIRDYWPMQMMAYTERARKMSEAELLALGSTAYWAKYPNGISDMPDKKFIETRIQNSKLPVPKQGW